MSSRETRQERRGLQRRFPEAFKDGMQSGAGLKGYPPGFAGWPLDRRNAWWAGANLGYLMAHPGRPAENDDV